MKPSEKVSGEGVWLVLTIHLDDRDYQEIRRVAALMLDQSEEECLREVYLPPIAKSVWCMVESPQKE